MHDISPRCTLMIAVPIFMMAVTVFACRQRSQASMSANNGTKPLIVSIGMLEQQVYRYNNALQYDSSKMLLQRYLNNVGTTATEKYYYNLYLAYTYKRLFDYSSTLLYLDSALATAAQSDSFSFFKANIRCQKSLVLFDTQNYGAADTIMQALERTGFAYIDTEYQAKITMQQGYLQYLKGHYTKAAEQYERALRLMKVGSPCDLPMIYGKQIELYGATGNNASIGAVYHKSIRCADSCGILKYKLYTSEVLKLTYEKKKDFARAFFAQKNFDSLSKIYDEKDNLFKLNELDKRYFADKKREELGLKERTIAKGRFFIILLIAAIIVLITASVAYIFWRRQKHSQQEKQRQFAYTKQLLEKIELERKRIATDLHDSISHELLALKRSLATPANNPIINKIDNIINDIRSISRNLHPVMFERVGLVYTIEQMVERVQQHNLLVTTDISYGGSLPPAVELQLYRILQEALSNTVKYAGAMAAKLTITEDGDNVFIEVRDNGKGFDVHSALESNKSFGLHNIIERSRAVGGWAKISATVTGTFINIKVPK